MKLDLRMVVFVGAVSSVSGGCAGKLRAVAHDRTYLTARSRCTAGPYEIRAKATGSRWGERIRVMVRSPRRIGGHYSIRVSGKIVARGWFGTPRSVENDRCRGGVSGGSVGSKAGQGETGSAAVGRPLVPVPASRIGKTEAKHVFPFYRIVGRSGPPVYADCQTETLHPNALEPGEDVHFVIWSDVPNDMEGVVFEVRHDVFGPDVAESKWLAHARDRVAACKKKRAERLDWAERILRARPRPLSKVPMCNEWRAVSVGGREVAHPVFLNGKLVGKRRRIRGGLTYRLPARIRRPCICWKRPEEETCWGSDGSESFKRGFWRRARSRLKKDSLVAFSINRVSLKGDTLWSFERRVSYSCVSRLDDADCWGPGGYRAFRRRAIGQAVVKPVGRGSSDSAGSPTPRATGLSGTERGR